MWRAQGARVQGVGEVGEHSLGLGRGCIWISCGVLKMTNVYYDAGCCKQRRLLDSGYGGVPRRRWYGCCWWHPAASNESIEYTGRRDRVPCAVNSHT